VAGWQISSTCESVFFDFTNISYGKVRVYRWPENIPKRSPTPRLPGPPGREQTGPKRAPNRRRAAQKPPGLLRQTPAVMPAPGAIPKVATFKVAQLQAAAYNPRAISDEALEGLRSSIQEFGCVAPIVVNVRTQRLQVIEGHQRLGPIRPLEKRDFDAVVRAGEKARARQAKSA